MVCSQKQSFRIIQIDHSHRSRSPEPENHVIWKLVKRFKQTGHLNIPKYIRLSTCFLQRTVEQGLERGRIKCSQVVPETSKETGMPYGYVAIFPHEVNILQQLLPRKCGRRHYCQWLLAKVEDDPCMLHNSSFLQVT
jgi:hypothetical protein